MITEIKNLRFSQPYWYTCLSLTAACHTDVPLCVCVYAQESDSKQLLKLCGNIGLVQILKCQSHIHQLVCQISLQREFRMCALLLTCVLASVFGEGMSCASSKTTQVTQIRLFSCTVRLREDEREEHSIRGC